MKLVIPLPTILSGGLIGPEVPWGEIPPSPPPEVRAEVHHRGSETLRYYTGRCDTGGVLIFRDGKLLCVLWPEHICQFVRLWSRS
jgi:hypothetical protein